MGKDNRESNYRPSVTVQVVVALVFAIFLIVPIYLQSIAVAPAEKKDSQEAMSYAMEYFGFYLEDVGQEAGVDFVHQTSKLDSRLDHIPANNRINRRFGLCFVTSTTMDGMIFI
jgi:hypothetical protein